MLVFLVSNGTDMASALLTSITWMGRCMPIRLRFFSIANKFSSQTTHTDLVGRPSAVQTSEEDVDVDMPQKPPQTWNFNCTMTKTLLDYNHWHMSGIQYGVLWTTLQTILLQKMTMQCQRMTYSSCMSFSFSHTNAYTNVQMDTMSIQDLWNS